METHTQTAENVHTKPVKERLKKTKRVNFKLDPRRVYLLDKEIVPALQGDRTYALTWLIDHFKELQRASGGVERFKAWKAAEAELEAWVEGGKI